MTMSNFVDITSSPAEIISIANGISARGGDLTAEITEINQAIVAHELDPRTFPSDQFTDGFTKEYGREVEGADGTKQPANEAVRAGALYCGTKLTEIGDFVSQAMVNYEASDQQGGADIASADA